MEIPSHELHAFRLVAQTLNFSLAAERAHITQSALSQRIQHLERRLGLTLFVRDRKATRLTEAGLRLLRFCQAKDHLETELLSDLTSDAKGKIAGHLRVAGYSSVLHSVMMPALAGLLRTHAGIKFEFSMHEMHELTGVLLRGEADFVVMDHVHQQNNLETHLLGEERYVLIQSSRHPVANIYLDHDPSDKFTTMFLKAQGQEKQGFTRSYVDDIDGVLTGTVLGLGQGVVPLHLMQKRLPIKIVKNYKPMRIPVVLHYFRQPYYSRLQTLAIDALKNNCAQYLSC
jgi:DNA-binding transcriptional LysR family regulator